MSLSVKFKNYSDIFSDEDTSVLLKFSQYEHNIKLMSEQKLSYELLYALSKWKLVILWEYLNTVLVKDWIQLSTSSAEVSILFVFKKDREIRLCVNYRGLNKIIIKNCCLLFLINEILDWMIDAKCFTKLNLRDAFHWIQIKKEDEWKTAFCMYYDHFKYMIMLFSLTNASVIFQSYINMILWGLLNVFYVIYLNNILIFLKNKNEHITHIKEVLERLYQFQLYAKLSKYNFMTNKVNFLSFIVSTDDMKIKSSCITVIMNWSKFTFIQEL